MFNSFHLDGIKAFDEHNYERAKNCFLQAIDNNPEVPESYLYLGTCFFFCSEPKRAISSLKKFIELRQSNPDEVANVSHAFDLLGQCYEMEHNSKAALTCYETATKIYPSGASAWNNMGLLFIKSAVHYLETDLVQSVKLFRASLAFITKALSISSENPVFLHSVASWYEQYIEVVVKVVQDEDAVMNNVAMNFSFAIHYYRKALAVCKEHEVTLRNIILSNLTECLAQYGHHFYKNNEYLKAQEIYLEALQFDPEHLIVINQIGMSLFKQDCFPEARKYFSSILNKTEDTQEIADAWLNIACTYRLENKWEQAEEALIQAKQHAPEDSSITEEEMRLIESKSAALLISTPQTLFGSSSSASQGAGCQEVSKSSCIFQLN
ncbi:photosystem I assembly protein Ycf3 [Legionella moravica]|uniref:Photosystem I assembly protein Ycf3 n=1 Tax=Legionella moravica TaxID=39962 RepID=A0A378JXR6_9GAMM|nr:tetratricopeptide repeat protein [Legionella moravica]KTD30830.1 photosystem I assembly protein Ycf3 [Legionella moravica]STX63344.1 photosystem I assembly protein Ycf3 [Legionella moravica]